MQLIDITGEGVMPGVGEISKKQPRGRPFPKGVSGNPGGRPKRTEEEVQLVEACKQKTPEALEVILNIMQYGLNDKVRLDAAKFIIERGWGKAMARIEHEPAPIEISRSIDPEEAYLLMLDGGVLEELPVEAQGA
jgi:hypothetical protein